MSVIYVPPRKRNKTTRPRVTSSSELMNPVSPLPDFVFPSEPVSPLVFPAAAATATATATVIAAKTPDSRVAVAASHPAPVKRTKMAYSAAELIVFLAKFFAYDLADLRQVAKYNDAIMDKLAPIVDGLRGILIPEVKQGKEQDLATRENIWDQFHRRMKTEAFLEYPEEQLKEIRDLILRSSCSKSIKAHFRDK